MEISVNSDAPLLIKTEGGEHTVQYKGRFLYSKKSPSSSVSTLISSITSFENTLFVFASPVLGYGLPFIISHLHSSSYLLIVEYDNALASLFEKTGHNWKSKNIQYLHSSNIGEIIKEVYISTSFNFKKCNLIRASGGYALYQDFYNNLFQNLEHEISNFWKNKITLIAMGHLYAKNIFKNIVNVLLNSQRTRVYALKKSYIDKPILVLGAGPSLDESYEFIQKNRNSLFLLAVDVSLPALLSLSIVPDAILLLEGQHWVEASFLASSAKDIVLFSDITSNPHMFHIMKGNIFLYGSNYAKLEFLKNIQDIFSNIPFFDSVGSVGLLAIQIALFISKGGVPIFHTGLDFSHSYGFSHAKGSSPWNNLMINNNRLKSLYPAESIFSDRVTKFLGKENKEVFSTPILQSYANLYKRLFSHFNNIFDIAKHGLVLRKITSEEVAQKHIEDFFKRKHTSDLSFIGINIETMPLINYLKNEKEKLETLKNMLIGVVAFDMDEFSSILKSSDYLYSHFPDSNSKIAEISFLKRIRIEIEVFYKIINICEGM